MIELNKPIFGLSAEEYHSHPSISNSLLKYLTAGSTPLDFWFNSWLNPDRVFDNQDTIAKKFGRAAHMLLLEGDEVFNQAWPVKPKVNATTEKGKLGQGEYDTLLHVRDAIMANPLAATILKGAKTEVSMFAEIEPGVIGRCRHDIWKPGYSADLKFVDDVSKADIGKDIANYGYDRQAEWYPRIMNLCGGANDNFITIFVSKSPPYHVLCVTYPEDLITVAKDRNNAALQRFIEYKDKYGNDKWPGYEPRVYTVYQPGMGDADGINLPNWWQYQ